MSGKHTAANPWFIFVLICIPILIGSIDLTAIVVVLPQATLDLLGPQGLWRANQALWAVTAYLLAYTISLALVGRLSDVLSRKVVFVACIVIFIIGALWAGLATEFPLQLLRSLPIWPEPDMLPLVSLIIGRIIQAIGAGASVSVGMALVSDIFPPEKRAEPISLIGALDSLGWVVGNLYAGLMLQILPSWRWLFLINAGIAVIALVLTVLALRGAKSARAPGLRFDWRGAILFAAILIALTIGIETLSSAPTEGYILLGSSALLLVLFIWLQIRTRNALIDMAFVRQREVRAALISNLIIGFGLILIVAGVPLAINLRAVFLRGEGLLTGALRAGVMLSALTIPLVMAVLVGEGRYRRVGAGLPVAMGFVIAIIGFMGTVLWTYTAPTPVIALPLALVGIGLGLTIGPLSLVVVDAAEESARGLASSLVLVMRLLGMTIGTPLAASLTLTLANAWATERANALSPDFRTIARPMLVPPMTVDALAHVMVVGAGACFFGLIVFYLPRALQTLRRIGLSPRVLLGGFPAMIAVVVLVGVLAARDSAMTPTILPNPIAHQLPPNVEFYAGFNIQQAFLLDSRRPLDAALDILQTLASAPTPTPAQPEPGQPTPEPQPQATPVATEAPPQPTEPPQTPWQPPDTPTDVVVKTLFRPRQWSNDNYQHFCPYALPPSDWQYCFNNGLLSWIGPQAAFALLPRTRADYDYLFVFQATNRNNAIQFATSLATALGEKPPYEAAQNVRLMDINTGMRDARQLAITDAYVVIGTPKAVSYMLNHGNVSLADQPGYRAIAARLPGQDFATLYIRSSNFETDLKPALLSLFPSPMMDAATRILGRLSPFTRTSNAPTLIGISLRVNERQMVLNVVASLPVSLQKLNAMPVQAAMLGYVPRHASMWTALKMNIAGMAREININDVLNTIAREGQSDALRNFLANPLMQGPITAFAQNIQNMLTHAQGDVLFVQQPGQVALVLPLEDREDSKAALALSALEGQLQFFGTLSGGMLKVELMGGKRVALGGSLIAALLPGGLNYTLTEDNLFVLASGVNAAEFVTAMRNGESAGGDSIKAQMQASLPGQPEKFFYAFVAPPSQTDSATLLLGGEIHEQTLYFDVVLQTK